METIEKTKQQLAYGNIKQYLSKCSKHLFVNNTKDEATQHPFKVMLIEVKNNDKTEYVMVGINLTPDKPYVQIREINENGLDQNSLHCLRRSLFGESLYKSVKRRKALETKFDEIKDLVAKEYVWGMNFTNKQAFKTKIESMLK